jgi:hypothetical protein
MSLGSWIPEGQKSTISLPSEAMLISFASMDEMAIEQLSENDLALLAPTMQVGVSLWLNQLDTFSDDTLKSLIKFFTLLEMKHNACRADQHSPAIACTKLLRKRGNKIDKELLAWIRSTSDNRYLPYGPL